MSSRHELKLLFTRKEIQSTIRRLSVEISREYHDKNPILLCVLKGSFMFMADLVRCLDFPLELDFVRLSSYGSGRESSGRIKLVLEPGSMIEGKHVLIIEDIIDTGITSAYLMDYLMKKKPASLRLCSLTDKPSRRKSPVKIDYLGLTVPDKFVVGYGIDWNEKYRYLPDIYTIED